jgi:stage II sporulation protein D
VGWRGRNRGRTACWAGGIVAIGAATWLVIGSCTPTAGPAAPIPAPAGPGPAQVHGEPDIRVGLAVGASTATVGGGSGLIVTDPAGSYLARIAQDEVWRIAITGTGLAVVSPAGGHSTPSSQLQIVGGDSGAPVLVNGRRYHGTLAVLRDRTGITLVNRVPLEAYLRGVVSAEMGRRVPAEQEALRAQAVVSRTYALRNVGRWAADGFDVYSTVADQVYGGFDSETPEGDEAVASTSGQILTYDGAPIDAFFYSTCGGRTADGTEVFRAADRPYLRSIPDLAEDGTPYCSISPRFRWREEWSGDALRNVLQRTLPAVLGTAAGEVRDLRDVRVTATTRSGRVGRLSIDLGRSSVDVDGPLIRQVLRSTSDAQLRSNVFTLTVTRAGGRVARVVADGAGAGHGVGFCQWGAVGRSRAGQDYQQIIAAYYSGATLERVY